MPYKAGAFRRFHSSLRLYVHARHRMPLFRHTVTTSQRATGGNWMSCVALSHSAKRTAYIIILIVYRATYLIMTPTSRVMNTLFIRRQHAHVFTFILYQPWNFFIDSWRRHTTCWYMDFALIIYFKHFDAQWYCTLMVINMQIAIYKFHCRSAFIKWNVKHFQCGTFIECRC